AGQDARLYGRRDARRYAKQIPDGRGRIVLRRSAYPTASEPAKDGADCSLSRRTGEGQGEGETDCSNSTFYRICQRLLNGQPPAPPSPAEDSRSMSRPRLPVPSG